MGWGRGLSSYGTAQCWLSLGPYGWRGIDELFRTPMGCGRRLVAYGVSLSSLWCCVSNVFKGVSLSALLLDWEAAISSVFFWFVPVASFDLVLFFLVCYIEVDFATTGCTV